MVRSAIPGTVGWRLKAVREASGLRLEDFIRLLNETSVRRLGADAPAFSQGRISKLETGVQRASLDDIAVYAAVDAQRRGKLWLAWDEAKDSARRPETPEELAARLGVEPPRRGPQFPAPAAAKKATQAGGQKRRPNR